MRQMRLSEVEAVSGATYSDNICWWAGIAGGFAGATIGAAALPGVGGPLGGLLGAGLVGGGCKLAFFFALQ